MSRTTELHPQFRRLLGEVAEKCRQAQQAMDAANKERAEILSLVTGYYRCDAVDEVAGLAVFYDKAEQDATAS